MNLKDKGSSALAVTMTRLWQDSANDLPMEDRLKALAHSLIAMANELGEVGQQPESHTHTDRPAMLAPRARQDLGDLALRTYRERRRRNEIFADDTLFGEPAWDILLDLFVAGEKNKRVAVTSACIGSGVPSTTALRWLNVLELRGLVEREDDNQDARRSFVRLTPKARDMMVEYFTHL
jgi:DNA-binding MarR family transcriptional regulator